MRTPDRPTTEPRTCATCKHISHGWDWCSETVLTGSSTQEMCGCPPAESIQPAQNQADLDKARAALAEAAQGAAPLDPDERYLRLREVSELLDLPAWHEDARTNNLGVDEVQGARWLATWLGVKIAGLDWIMPEGAAPLDVDRLTAIIESRMSRDLAWLADDGKTVNRLGPEQVAHALMHLHRTGDVVSGLPPLEGAAPRAEGLLEAATALADATAAEHADCTSDHCHWCPLVDAVRAASRPSDERVPESEDPR